MCVIVVVVIHITVIMLAKFELTRLWLLFCYVFTPFFLVVVCEFLCHGKNMLKMKFAYLKVLSTHALTHTHMLTAL